MREEIRESENAGMQRGEQEIFKSERQKTRERERESNSEKGEDRQRMKSREKIRRR